MKKLITICIALCYFVVSSGMVVNIHYCMGKISSVKTTVATTKKTCKCKANAKPKKCCSSETKLIKATQHNISNNNIDVEAPLFTETQDCAIYLNYTQPQYFSRKTNTYKAHAPPLISGEPLFILHNVFRI